MVYLVLVLLNKLGYARGQVWGTHADERIDLYDAPEQERQQWTQDGEKDEESQEHGPWSLAATT